MAHPPNALAGGGNGASAIAPLPIAALAGALPTTVMRYWRVAVLRSTDELQLSYALRCRVYCEERGFLSMTDYPDGVESDKYDPYSLHVGSFDGEGAMVGSARLVLRSELDFPMFDHCTIDPEWRRKLDAIPKLAEISRLVVSRQYRRRSSDGHYGIQHPEDLDAGDRRGKARAPDGTPESDRRGQYSVAISLFKGMYQAGRRLQMTHALSAMEMTLLRLLQRYHFPFEKIGPECDYFGPVTPFILDVAKTEERLAADCPDLYQEFNDGLDTESATPNFVV